MNSLTAFTVWTLPFLAIAAAPKKPKAKKIGKAASIIAANIEAIRAMNAAELFTFAVLNDLNSKAGFSSYKRELLAVGIDYEAIRDGAREAKADTLAASVTHTLTLHCDAKARCQRFAICDANGSPLWHGRFFDDDRSFSYGDRNEQSACECATARKAVWLASKVAEAVGGVVALTLKVDAQWLCSLSGKAKIIADDARRLNVVLELEWIPGSTNPADEFTTCSGFKKWNDNDLGALAVNLQPQPSHNKSCLAQAASA